MVLGASQAYKFAATVLDESGDVAGSAKLVSSGEEGVVCAVCSEQESKYTCPR